MDFLLEADSDIQREVFFSVASLLNLEVDLIFLDTTSTYFETVDEDELRRYGHSKDSRDDRPQAVVVLAITKEGLPVKCWTFAGNTADASIVRKVKDELGAWRLGRLIWCIDRGFTSKDNLSYLTRAGDHFIAGEKLRSGQSQTKEALSRPGRYQSVRPGLKVKEIQTERGRYVLCHSDETAERDGATRARHIERIEAELVKLRQLKGRPHTRAACALRSHPALGRYVRQNKDGRLRIDRAKVRAEEKLDGKYLLSTFRHHTVGCRDCPWLEATLPSRARFSGS